jgi:hypothetical protein
MSMPPPRSSDNLNLFIPYKYWGEGKSLEKCSFLNFLNNSNIGGGGSSTLLVTYRVVKRRQWLQKVNKVCLAVHKLIHAGPVMARRQNDVDVVSLGL